MAASGCRAAGYRLTGETLRHICCRHLYGADRLLTVWLAEDHVAVLAVGPHTRAGDDIYDLLTGSLQVEPTAEERAKPACCDEEGNPPLNAGAATATIDAVAVLERRHKRPRKRRRV